MIISLKESWKKSNNRGFITDRISHIKTDIIQPILENEINVFDEVLQDIKNNFSGHSHENLRKVVCITITSLLFRKTQGTIFRKIKVTPLGKNVFS